MRFLHFNQLWTLTIYPLSCICMLGCETRDAGFRNISGQHLKIEFVSYVNSGVRAVDLPANREAFIPMPACVNATLTDAGGQVLWTQRDIDVAPSSFAAYANRAAEGPRWIEYLVDRDGIFPIPHDLIVGAAWLTHVKDIKGLQVPNVHCDR
jgi:hypothetical protein